MISLLQPSHSSAATVGTVRLPSKRARVRQPRVLNQKLFTDALVREQKRADRFEEAFVLVLISLENGTLNPPR